MTVRREPALIPYHNFHFSHSWLPGQSAFLSLEAMLTFAPWPSHLRSAQSHGPLGHKLREETHTGTGRAVGYLSREFGRSDISSMVHKEEAWISNEFYPLVTWTTDQCRRSGSPRLEPSKEQSSEEICYRPGSKGTEGKPHVSIMRA